MDDSLKKKFEAALALAHQHDLDAAILQLKALREAASEEAFLGDILHALGMTYAQRRDFKEALNYLKEAVAQAPEVAEFHNNLGNAYKAVGQLDLAQRHYLEALRLKSPYPQAHNNLGVLLYKLGNYDEAIAHFQKAVRMDPLAVDTHYNLANTYILQDKLLDGAAHYQEVLKLRPDHLGALHNLGITLCALKRFQDAEPLLKKVIEREPNNVDALYHLGVIASATAKMEEATAFFSAVLNIDPNQASSHHNLATVYLHLQKPDLALKHFQTALQLDPNNQTAKHMVDALMGKTSPEGAPTEFTRALFDQYAYNYDQHVKNQLHYQVPTLLRQAMSSFIAEQDLWDTLDLGCGSGLCAPLFADLATKLIGVDLSPNMLAVAKQRGGYFSLYCDDALNFLDHHQNQYDLIIAADVLVYFGELQTLFRATSSSLKEKGFFCFSIELLKNSTSDYQLKATGRYTHQLGYIHQLAKQLGFVIRHEQEATLRHQEDIAVLGQILVLQKS